MRRFGQAYLILGLAITTGLVLRTVAGASKRTITHDEAVSYLAATGHQGEYERVVQGLQPAGTWVSAAQLKRMVRLEKPYCLKQIGFDLARHDFHPPLYFWFLHLWALVVDVHVWIGPALNALLAATATLLLFKLALDVLGDHIGASLVASTWTTSPAVASVSLEARQYDLLALCTILLVWPIMRRSDLTRQPTMGESVVIAVSTAGGLLTHYHFALVILGCIVWLGARLGRRDTRRLVASVAAMGVGAAMFLVFHPDFFLSFRRYGVGEPFEMVEFVRRLQAVLATLSGFFVYGTVFKLIALFLVCCVVLWLFVACIRKQFDTARLRLNHGASALVFFFLWMAGATIVLYLTFRSPEHAMGPKYLSSAWPFLAFVPILVWRQFGRSGLLLPASVCLIVSMFGISSVRHSIHLAGTLEDPGPLLDRHDRIVVDNVKAGVLPRIIWHVPDEKLVFAADLADLLENRDQWLNELSGKSLYVSIPDYSSTEGQRQTMLRVIRETHEIVAVDGGIWGVGHVYALQPNRLLTPKGP